MKRFLEHTWFLLKVLTYPFKPYQIKGYIGKIKHGVPYFLPRRWIDQKNGYSRAIPIKYFGINFCELGWKTKWEDKRFEWSPALSIVLFGIQIHIWIMNGNRTDVYWEAVLWYHHDTKGTTEERLLQLFKLYKCTWTAHSKGNKTTTDYYPLILKNKYHKLYKNNK